jgi:hypothetical protein
VSLPLQLREQLPATSRVLASLKRLAELEGVDAALSAGELPQSARSILPKVARLPCTGSATVSRGPPVTTIGARQHQDPKPEPCHPQNQPPCESPASTGYPQLNCLWCIC